MSEGTLKRVRGFEKNRLEALADGIFAVALTLLVLDIKLPDNIASASNDDLWTRLAALERHFAIYVISFVVIAMYWVSHHIQFHFVRYTDRRLIWINLIYLLLVSFVPFSTDLVGDHPALILPCWIYGLTLLALSGVSYTHVDYLARHPFLATSHLSPAIEGLLKRRIVIFTVVPVLSMLVALYSTRLSLYCYVLLLAAHFFSTAIDEHVHTVPEDIPE